MNIPLTPKQLANFWANVKKAGPGDCWLWTGNIAPNGYGAFRCGRTVGAHRISFLIAHGRIPAGRWILHKCDVRGCVRPDHLYAGMPTDNTQDCISKGRFHRKYRLTPEQRAGVRESTESTSLLAARFNVSPGTIRRARNSTRFYDKEAA